MLLLYVHELYVPCINSYVCLLSFYIFLCVPFIYYCNIILYYNVMFGVKHFGTPSVFIMCYTNKVDWMGFVIIACL